MDREYEQVATLTTMRSTTGSASSNLADDHVVRRFRAKPKSDEWVNSCFSIFKRHVLGYLDLHSVLERFQLEVLARDKELGANERSGFFRSKGANWRFLVLNEFWANGDRLWAVWTR